MGTTMTYNPASVADELAAANAQLDRYKQAEDAARWQRNALVRAKQDLAKPLSPADLPDADLIGGGARYHNFPGVTVAALLAIAADLGGGYDNLPPLELPAGEWADSFGPQPPIHLAAQGRWPKALVTRVRKGLAEARARGLVRRDSDRHVAVDPMLAHLGVFTWQNEADVTTTLLPRLHRLDGSMRFLAYTFVHALSQAGAALLDQILEGPTVELAPATPWPKPANTYGEELAWTPLVK